MELHTKGSLCSALYMHLCMHLDLTLFLFFSMQLYSIDLEFDGFVSSCTVYMHNAALLFYVFN